MKFEYLYTVKLSVFNLIITVFLLWLTLRINTSYETYLAYALILTVGILHGANDLSLINHLHKKSEAFNYWFLAMYIGVIVLISLAFIKLPLVALVVFIFFSCYHFGEQHFYNQLRLHNTMAQLLYMGYGMLIFGILFYFNKAATASIILELTNFNVGSPYFDGFLLLSVLVTGIAAYLNRNNFKRSINHFQEVFLVFLFVLLFKMASLLWGFSIYFIVWHSLPSLRDQTYTLYGKLDSMSYITYFKSSVLYWGVSIFGLVIVFYISQALHIRFITLFFAFLAAVTIPHVIVMHFLNKV